MLPSSPGRAEVDKKIHAVGLAYASRMGLRHDEAQDCAVEFLEHIFKRNQPIPSSAWLHRCAHNFACNYVRALARRRAKEQTWSERYADNAEQQRDSHAAPTPGPKTLFLQKELWEQVVGAVRQLTPTQQALFIRYYLRNYSIRDLATRTGRTPHAIEESLSNIRKRLNQILQKQGWTEQDAALLFRTASRGQTRSAAL